MQKNIINTEKAPAPIGPYSQAVSVGGMLFISGQICIDPATGELVNKNVQEEAEQVMKNLSAILSHAGLGFDAVIKTSIFLTSMNDFPLVNEVYGKFFDGSYPARETVAVSALPKLVNVEISMIAALK